MSETNNVNETNQSREQQQGQRVELPSIPGSGGTVLGDALRILAAKYAEKLNIPPEVAVQVADEVLREVAADDDEIARMLRGVSTVEKLVQLSQGEVSRRVADIAAAKLINRLAERLDGGEDGDMEREMMKWIRFAQRMRIAMEAVRLAFADVQPHQQPSFDSRIIADALRSAVSESIRELTEVMRQQQERLNKLEEIVRELYDRRRQEETLKLIEEIRRGFDERIAELHRKFEELKSVVNSSSSSSVITNELTIDRIEELISKLKRLGFVIKSPEEVINEIQEKIKKGELLPEEMKSLREELLRLVREQEGERMKYVDKEYEIKKIEREKLSEAFKQLIVSLAELLRDPERFGKLVSLLSQLAGGGGSAQASPRPTVPTINIPSLRGLIAGAKLGGGAVAKNAGGGEGQVRQAVPKLPSPATSNSGNVQGSGVRNEPPKPAEGQNVGVEAGGEPRGEAGVQGSGG